MRHSGGAHCYAALLVRPPSTLEGPGDDINLFPEIVRDHCVFAGTGIEAQKASCHPLISTAAYDPLPDTSAEAGSRMPRQVGRVEELMSFFRGLRLGLYKTAGCRCSNGRCGCR